MTSTQSQTPLATTTTTAVTGSTASSPVTSPTPIQPASGTTETVRISLSDAELDQATEWNQQRIDKKWAAEQQRVGQEWQRMVSNQPAPVSSNLFGPSPSLTSLTRLSRLAIGWMSLSGSTRSASLGSTKPALHSSPPSSPNTSQISHPRPTPEQGPPQRRPRARPRRSGPCSKARATWPEP